MKERFALFQVKFSTFIHKTAQILRDGIRTNRELKYGRIFLSLSRFAYIKKRNCIKEIVELYKYVFLCWSILSYRIITHYHCFAHLLHLVHSFISHKTPCCAGTWKRPKYFKHYNIQHNSLTRERIDGLSRNRGRLCCCFCWSVSIKTCLLLNKAIVVWILVPIDHRRICWDCWWC
jgi:hypothetical protein